MIGGQVVATPLKLWQLHHKIDQAFQTFLVNVGYEVHIEDKKSHYTNVDPIIQSVLHKMSLRHNYTTDNTTRVIEAILGQVFAYSLMFVLHYSI